eukprot:TRINITY_DN2063_c0_g1_i1.p1 TRINITY_DN2063_c0_g1~~TRINITY_DN2063_c0_g1_i1.p1  ORF type:complete len:130 (-),score=23.18 TRINITY_DN2063_c0_g1_i1:98-487(-)
MPEGAWKHSFPTHLRRQKGRKTSLQKRMRSKHQDLLANLEKVENRIVSKRRAEMLQAKRIAAEREEGGPEQPATEALIKKKKLLKKKTAKRKAEDQQPSNPDYSLQSELPKRRKKRSVLAPPPGPEEFD